MSVFRIQGVDNLAESFASAVAQFADNEAVRCGVRAMTYRELDEVSTRWAARLHERGCAGRPVAVFQHRSADMITAILAVVKAGGWYVPLDPATPSRRLSGILQDVGPALALTSGDLAPRLPAEVPAIALDDATDRPPPSAIPALARHVPGNSYSYAIFTSGTSGRPKGVAVTHSNVLGLFRAAGSLFDVRPDDTWTLFHSMAFDFSVWEMWGALLSGARVVVVPSDIARNPAAFWELLGRERVTVLSQTPTAFSRLIAEDSGHAERLPLRWVVLGGEALRFSDCRPWMDKYGEEPPVLVNMYGITETTVHASYHRVRRADLDQADSLIGRPLPGQDILLVDEGLTAVEPGQAGEIIVTGSGVAAGYLNDPELTRERFIELAGPDGQQVRGYRSGDIAVRTPQGDLAYRGRADEQVKIRGHRVELGEIQAALTALAGVRQAAVIAHRPGPSGGPVVKQRHVRTGIRPVRDLIRGGTGRADAADPPVRIVAYVVAGDGFDVGHMVAQLHERLPDYMMPAFLVPVGEIPVNRNGKLAVDRLPAPSAALALRPAIPAGGPGRAGEPQARVAALCGAFEEVLGVDGVTEDDSFFSVGGDSILALDLCTAAERRGLPLELDDVYTLQTPRALAAVASEGKGAGHGVAPFSLLGEADRALLPRPGIEDAYPLARLQAGVLFHSAYGSERNMYCDIFRFRLAARFDPGAFQAAVDQAIARHDILRSSFHFSGFSEPLQIVHATAACPVTVDDLSDLSPDRQQAALDAWLAREQSSPYDWGRPPLMRFTVHLLGGDEFVLWMGFHDALLDGWSESALLTEILTEYVRRCQGRGGHPAPRPARRFADFVALEQAALRDESTAKFWSAELAGVEPMLLPRLAAGEQDAHRGQFGCLSVDIDPELSARLEKISAARKVSLKHVLLAAHARVQAALSAREEVLLSVEWNGRPEGEGSTEVLGTHLNVVPYRLRTGGLSWAELIDAAWAKERELLPWRRFPYAELLHLVGAADLSDILFNYTHFHEYEALRSAGIQIIEAEGYNQTSLTLRVEFNKDPFTELLNLDIEANLERITEGQLRVTAEMYRNALHSLVSDVGAVPTLRDLLDEERLREIMKGFQGPRVPLNEGGWFELFDVAVARDPGRGAAVSGGEEICYGDLRERAGAMAEWLARRGVRRGDVVGLVAERGISYLIAVLAILRVGAVYLPLPSGPRLRVQRMLRRSGARLVLCDEAFPVGETSGDAVEFVDLAPAMAQAESLRPYAGPKPGSRDAAYMIFTSGSTGAPKGAVIRHGGMLNHILAKIEAVGLTPSDRVSQDAAATFDISVWQWLAPLAVGATTVIYPDAVGQNPPRLLRALAADGDDTRGHTVRPERNARGAGALRHRWLPAVRAALGRVPGRDPATQARQRVPPDHARHPDAEHVGRYRDFRRLYAPRDHRRGRRARGVRSGRPPDQEHQRLRSRRSPRPGSGRHPGRAVCRGYRGRSRVPQRR
jgi:amino acid adenylation domain-containing protein